MKELLIELVKENLSLQQQIEALKCQFEKARSEYEYCLKDIREQGKAFNKMENPPAPPENTNQINLSVDDLVSAVQAEMRENHKGLLDKLRGDI